MNEKYSHYVLYMMVKVYTNIEAEWIRSEYYFKNIYQECTDTQW